MNDQFPSDKFKKQEFTFSKQELSLVNSYHTIKTLGQMAEIMINNLISSTVMPRIGIVPGNDKHIQYDNATNTITVYTELHPEGESNGK